MIVSSEALAIEREDPARKESDLNNRDPLLRVRGAMQDGPGGQSQAETCNMKKAALSRDLGTAISGSVILAKGRALIGLVR